MKKTLLHIATAFSIIASGLMPTVSHAQYLKLHDFDGAANGSYPQESLISDGTFLYGMTPQGGTNSMGTIFKIKPDGTGYVKLLDFAGASNGGYPSGSLISDGTFLYGMTPQGGTNSLGTVFKIKPDGTGYVKLLDFAGTANGNYPKGSLISDGIFLYGMTEGSGTNNLGTIFKIMPDGTGYVKLLDFAGTSNGNSPHGSLISDGTFLYGMTRYGSTNGMGNIFKIKTDGTGYVTLLDFAGTSNGSNPLESLISDGTFLYGMTRSGGTNGMGTAFKIKVDGTGYVKLLDFAGASNGGYPSGSLRFGGSFLYGMTEQGGTNSKGTLFKIMPDGTGYIKLLDFDGTANGSYPFGSLISDAAYLYGMTTSGGSADAGTVFKYNFCTATTGTDVQVACDSYTWIDGNTYTTSNNTATDTLINAAGCDSVITLDLTITLSPLDQAVSITQNEFCDSGSTTVSLASSEIGVNYILRNNSTNNTVAGPVAGTGAGIAFNTGTITSTTTYNVLAEKSQNGTFALNFDGVDDYVEVPSGISLANQSFTVEFWAKRTGTGTYDYVIGQQSSASLNNSLHIGFNNNNTFSFAFYGNDLVVTNPATTDGQYHHWACVYIAGQTGTDRYIYLDGVLVGSDNSSGDYTGSGALRIGRNMFVGSQFIGDIDEVRIWSVSRTQTEVQNNRLNCLTGTETGLTAYYPFEDGPGSSIATDLAGGNNGTLTNMDPTTDWVSGAPSVVCAPVCQAQMSQDVTVTILNSTTGIDFQQHCNTYTWINGITYTASNNTATDTLINAAGCDSIVTLNLTITTTPLNQAVSAVQNELCDSGSTVVTLGSSEVGVHYYLRNDADNSIVDGPVEGTGSALALNTGNIDTTKTYNVFASKAAVNQVLEFDGVDDYVELANESAFDFTTNMTVEFWVKSSGFDQWDGFVTKGDDSWRIHANSSGTVNFAGTGGFTDINSTTQINDGEWHHVTATYDGATAKIYIDGTLESSSAGTGSIDNSIYKVAIGENLQQTGRFLNGQIDQVRIWNVARTATDIAGNMNSCIPPSESGLVALFDMEDTTGSSTLTDRTMKGNDGTLMNMDVNAAWVVDAGPVSCMECNTEMSQNVTILVNQSTSGTDVITACNSYTWIDGVTYTSSNNTAKDTLINAAGCDSVVTLNLTINYSSTGTDTITACDSYTWIDGVTYTSNNNTAKDTLTNAAGCDSVVTLNLMIKNSSTGTDIITACDSYTWVDGVTYTSNNNTAKDTLINAAGCDSVVTLNLTINNSSTGTDIITACDSYTWINGVTYTTSNNTAKDTLTNTAGCDSVVTLNLTINNNTGTDVITACDSYTWIDGNTYTANNNTATHTLTNAAGCDSVVTLNLTVNSVNTNISQSGLTITSDETGATYQWIDCDASNVALNNETAQSFTATVNGSYAVIITENGCSDTSVCVNITSVGLEQQTSENKLTVYPNPSRDKVTLVSTSDLNGALVKIITVTGQVLIETKINSGNTHSVDIRNFAPGLYFIEVGQGDMHTRMKVVKQ